MSVLRQGNWLSQQRVDVSHIRAIESSIAADFDVAMGLILGGGGPQVVGGFTLNTTGAVGFPATNLQLQVAGSTAIHYGASESGSLFWVPSTRANETLNASNTNLTGSFTAGTTNYLGIDLIRTADSTTSDNIQFLDANALVELSNTVPLGRTLNYRIVISIIPFSSTTNICPIAKVVTDASGNVTSIVDARQMLFRLGSGSDLPNPQFSYSFPQGRNEGTNANPFQGGDKAFSSFSDFKNAVLTRLWELGGGEYWYSPTSDRSTKLVGAGATLANGDYFSWSGTDLTWQNAAVVFSNSTGYFNEIANQTGTSPGLTNLADGDCIYVDLDRTQNRTRAGTPITVTKTPMQTLGSPVIPGARFVLAWRVGATVIVRDRAPTALAATSLANGIVTLSTSAPGSSIQPVVATWDASSLAHAAGMTRTASTLSIGAGGLTFASSVATTGTAVGIILNNTVNLTTAGDKIVSIRNLNSEKSFFDLAGKFNGGVNAIGTASIGAINLAAQSAPSAPNNGDIWFDSSATAFKACLSSMVYQWFSKLLPVSGIPGNAPSTTYILAPVSNSTAAAATVSALGTTRHIVPARQLLAFGIQTSTTTVGGTIQAQIYDSGSAVGPIITMVAGSVAGSYAATVGSSTAITGSLELRIVNGVGVTTGLGQVAGYIEIF